MAMVTAAAAEADYKKAVAAGERGLAAREKLTEMDGTFTTYKKIGEHGYAWWPGEVQQYRELLPFTDGTKGTLVAKLPLVWNFRRDPTDIGIKEGWFKNAPDLKAWGRSAEARHGRIAVRTRRRLGEIANGYLRPGPGDRHERL